MASTIWKKWVTGAALTLWLGGLTACQGPSTTGPLASVAGGTGPASALVYVADVAQAPENETPQAQPVPGVEPEVQMQPQPDPVPETDLEPEPIELQPTAPGPEGAVLDEGLDRRDWQAQHTGPARGVVVHPPLYFEDCPRHTTLSPLAPAADESRFRAALRPHDDRPWTMSKFADSALQYGKWAVDTVVLPARLLVEPPWTMQPGVARD